MASMTRETGFSLCLIYLVNKWVRDGSLFLFANKQKHTTDQFDRRQLAS